MPWSCKEDDCKADRDQRTHQRGVPAADIGGERHRHENDDAGIWTGDPHAREREDGAMRPGM